MHCFLGKCIPPKGECIIFWSNALPLCENVSVWKIDFANGETVFRLEIALADDVHDFRSVSLGFQGRFPRSGSCRSISNRRKA
jgi:hypothetical protein